MTDKIDEAIDKVLANGSAPTVPDIIGLPPASLYEPALRAMAAVLNSHGFLIGTTQLQRTPDSDVLMVQIPKRTPGILVPRAPN